MTKVKRYQALASRNSVPLVVAVVADIRNEDDLEEFENILLGQDDSLFAERPQLSGALWVRKSHNGKWEIKGFVNRRAYLPLCPELATAPTGE